MYPASVEYLNRQRIIPNWGGGLWEHQYIYLFFPFSLFVSVYVYASMCDFVCIALLLPFVLGFCLSVSFFFSIVFGTCYHWWICVLVWLLSSFFLFFLPFILSHVDDAPARHQGCASEVGEPSSGHWSTRDLPAPRNIKRWKSPRDLHLNAKTQLHSMTSKLQCWTPYAKQLARQEHNPIH